MPGTRERPRAPARPGGSHGSSDGADLTRILLVEGDDDEAKAICESLAQQGAYQVTRAKSVLDAIRTAGESPFDAAILEYDLPDGTGLDLLDFLRIESPGIRILMLSGEGSESIAFHALSHGAGDYLVKDHHLERELPRRLDALLDQGHPQTAFVETLRPSQKPYESGAEVIEEPPGTEEDGRAPARAVTLEPLLTDALGNQVFAAAVYDSHGRPVAARLVPPLNPHGVGFGLASIHGQIGALWVNADLKPTSYVALVHVEGGLLGLTAVPGPYLVALLMEQSTPHEKALKRLVTVATKVGDALKG